MEEAEWRCATCSALQAETHTWGSALRADGATCLELPTALGSVLGWFLLVLATFAPLTPLARDPSWTDWTQLGAGLIALSVAALRGARRSPKVTARRGWGHFLILFGLGLRLYAWQGQQVQDRGWAERNGALFLGVGVVLLLLGGRRRPSPEGSPPRAKDAA